MGITKEYVNELLDEPMKDINWFKDGIEPKMKKFRLQYNYEEAGDFGNLHQVEFYSKKIGGNIDFWDSGMLGIFVEDYETDKIVIDVLLDIDEIKEQKSALKKLFKYILKSKTWI